MRAVIWSKNNCAICDRAKALLDSKKISYEERNIEDEFSPWTPEDFFKAVNVIEPSLIRVESDESTYDFHIMLRVEIESKLIDGSLKVKDLPEIIPLPNHGQLDLISRIYLQ